MCESCNARTDTPWWKTTSGLVVLTLVVMLLALAVIGGAMKLYDGQKRAAAGCAQAAPLSIAYQTALTRDRSAGVKSLLADTGAFARDVDRQDLLACPAITSLLAQGSASIRTFCQDCAGRLARLARSPSANP